MSSVPDSVLFVDAVPFRKSLALLFKAHQLESKMFDSAGSFRQRGRGGGSGCIVLDVHMPGLSGLDLQAWLAKLGCTMPIIFLTGRGGSPMSVQATQLGAVDYLTRQWMRWCCSASARRPWRRISAAMSRAPRSTPCARGCER
jgi:FixJ family two-component response regulator